MSTFANPVLPGCHPDPSVCRVGADYYLVTSTFEYFPGLPIYHSRDLVHWRLLGHVLDRPSQLPLQGVRPSGGGAGREPGPLGCPAFVFPTAGVLP